MDILRAKIPDNTKVLLVTGGTRTWHMNDAEEYYVYAANILYPLTAINNLKDEEKEKVQKMADELLAKFGVDIEGLQVWEVENVDGSNRLNNLNNYVGQYMTDSRFFSSIIDYGASYAPADKYDLILWDHGGGLDGYGSDELLRDYIKEYPDEEGRFLTRCFL